MYDHDRGESCRYKTTIHAYVTVVEKLQQAYGNVYSHDNVMMSGTHTHSGPAGYSSYTMYDITSLGFHQQNFDVIVNGIVASIQQAHESLSKGGTMYMNTGELLDSNAKYS
jgi:neutral ceramidase